MLGLLTKHGVKMARHWVRYMYFVCFLMVAVFLPLDSAQFLVGHELHL